MCLLFVKPASADHLTEAQVADFFTRNSDGYGAMYAKDGVLYTSKALGTKAEWVKFYMDHQAMGIDMAFHLRMKTHGAIDLENCHPYPVYNFDGVPTADIAVAMMHNGVLSTGNSADHTKSDTWHYVRDYIHALTHGNPSVIFNPKFAEVISKHIGGGNKFVLMDSSGNTQIINKSSGIEWNGIWFSNTYAWQPHNDVLYPGAMPKTAYYGGGYNYNAGYKSTAAQRALGFDDADDGFESVGKSKHTVKRKKVKLSKEQRINAQRALKSGVNREHARRAAITPITTPLNLNSVLSSDVDYVMDIVRMVEDPEGDLQQVYPSDARRLILAHGVDKVFKLVESALFDEVGADLLFDIFTRTSKSKLYFELLERFEGFKDEAGVIDEAVVAHEEEKAADAELAELMKLANGETTGV